MGTQTLIPDGPIAIDAVLRSAVALATGRVDEGLEPEARVFLDELNEIGRRALWEGVPAGG